MTVTRSAAIHAGAAAAAGTQHAVLVTRPGGPDDPLAARLVAAGIRVHAVPTVTTQPVPPGGELDRAVADLAHTDWVVLTSAAAVAALCGAMGRTVGPCPPSATRPRFAAVGTATAAALERAGLQVAATSVDGTGMGLVPALGAADELRGRRILLPRASAADGGLPASLRALGVDVREVVAYETVEGPPASRPALRAALEDPDLHAVVVASGSAVRGIVGLAGLPGPAADRRADRLATIPFVSIGSATSDEVRRLGLPLAAEAATPSVDALADAVLALLAVSAAPARVPAATPRLEVPG